MKKELLSCLALPALSVCLFAQTDPTGHWTIRRYGGELISPAMRLQSRACVNDDVVDVQIVGGSAGGDVLFLFGETSAQVPLSPVFPLGVLLVPTYSSHTMQVADSEGVATMTFNPAAYGNGEVVYVQAMEVLGKGIARFSSGYEIELHNSGEWTYQGPEMSASIAVQESPRSFDMLLTFETPSTGWSARWDSQLQRKVNGITKVYVTLEYPASAPNQTQSQVGVSVDLGAHPGYGVEIWVDQVQWGTDPYPNHQLASVEDSHNTCFLSAAISDEGKKEKPRQVGGSLEAGEHAGVQTRQQKLRLSRGQY